MNHRFFRASRRRAFLAFAAAAAACAMALPGVANAEWQRGVNFTTYRPNAYAMPGTTTSLQRVAADGNDSVEIVSTWYSPNATSNTIAPDSTRTPTDYSVLQAMQTARSQGLAVVLKPHVDIDDGTWRGAIHPSKPSQWFSSYRSFILGSAPAWDNLLIGAVIATVALTGIEAASGLAGELRMRGQDLRRLVALGTVTVLIWFVAVSIIALMAAPVVGGHTALGSSDVQAPVLGVVTAYGAPGGALVHALRYAVGAIAALVLATALNGQMLGLSRLSYSLATNRQIPSAVGKLAGDPAAPFISIIIAAVLSFVLVLTMDIKTLAGIFAYGAMLALTIAHVSIVTLRFREPDFERPFKVPWSFELRGRSVPVPALVGALLSFLAWVSVLALHSGARYVGSGWMVAGILLYVVYRKSQGKSLRKRFTIPAAALSEAPEVEYGSILVPVFGSPLDDDIVGTAGRLASEDSEPGEGGTVIEALYVLEVPMALPLDARVPDDRITAARRALARAKEVGEEYEGVEVATAVVRARSVGAGIVDEARRRGVDAIVVAAESPTRVRGGALLGGRGGPRERFVGEMTRYIVEKAPCRVILTAAPAGEDGIREGVAP